MMMIIFQLILVILVLTCLFWQKVIDKLILTLSGHQIRIKKISRILKTNLTIKISKSRELSHNLSSSKVNMLKC